MRRRSRSNAGRRNALRVRAVDDEDDGDDHDFMRMIDEDLALEEREAVAARKRMNRRRRDARHKGSAGRRESRARADGKRNAQPARKEFKRITKGCQRAQRFPGRCETDPKDASESKRALRGFNGP